MITIYKSVKQSYFPTPEVLEMLETFRRIVNDCIRIAIENDVSTLKRLSLLSYPRLEKYKIVSYFKMTAIKRAVGLISARMKSIKRGYKPRMPYVWKPHLRTFWGFKITEDALYLPMSDNRRREKNYFEIKFNDYTKAQLKGCKVATIVLTPTHIVLTYSKEIQEMGHENTVGIDRNIGNVTCGNQEQILTFDVSTAVSIAENTRSVMHAFMRNDVRIRKKMAAKYGQRRRNRVNQLLHKVSKAIVQDAKARKAAIVFEDITFIRKLYQKGNGQGRDYRSKMNSWPFYELKRQVEYKAAWEGIRVITLTKGETRGTSQLCPQCGERTQGDRLHRRELWCERCKRWMDRDVIAAMNIAHRGRLHFDRPQGAASEAMKGNPMTMPVILRVDAAKPILYWRNMQCKRLV